jgi:hypothetical protein
MAILIGFVNNNADRFVGGIELREESKPGEDLARALESQVRERFPVEESRPVHIILGLERTGEDFRTVNDQDVRPARVLLPGEYIQQAG